MMRRLDSMEEQIDFQPLVSYHEDMSTKSKATKNSGGVQLPVFIEKDEDGFYVVECPVFEGCYSQGKTVDEALKNIREVISVIVEERQSRDILAAYHPKEMSLHTITI